MVLKDPESLKESPLPEGTRLFTVDDALELASAIQDSNLHNFTRWPDPYEVKHAEGYLEDITANWGYTTACLAITISDKIVGAIEARPLIAEEKLVVDSSGEEILSIGYWIHTDYRRRGLASKTLSNFIPWLESNTAQYNELTARTKPENIASQKILLSNDFYKNKQTDFMIYFRRPISK